MKQRGKRSATSLATVVNFPTKFAEPPEELTEAQATVWRRIVASKPIDWFDESTEVLLAGYCCLWVDRERVRAQMDAFETEWLTKESGVKRFNDLQKIEDRILGRLTSLGTKMRLTQQSRYRANMADSEVRKVRGERPWLVEED